MGFRYKVDNIFRSPAFWAFCLSGIAGVLVDADHVIAYYFPQLPYHQWFPAPQLQQWVPLERLRPFHPQLLLISGIIIFGLCAYLARLYIKSVLKRRHE